MNPRFVIDASITMAWCFDDEGEPLKQQVLSALQVGTAIVPAIWTLEVANVLLVAERRGRLPRASSEQFIALLEKLPISVDTTSALSISARILTLGRDYSLSSYDAAYLELAMREGLPLATLDKGLLAAMDALGIAAFSGTVMQV